MSESFKDFPAILFCSFTEYEIIEKFMNNPKKYREEFEDKSPDFSICASDTPVWEVVKCDITSAGDPYFLTPKQAGVLWEYACNRVGFTSNQENPFQ